MDVGRIQGYQNVGRKLDRPGNERVDDRSPAAEKSRSEDVASISQSGREVSELVERAKSDDGERDRIVADAQARLESGELDDPDVYRQVAERLIG